MGHSHKVTAISAKSASKASSTDKDDRDSDGSSLNAEEPSSSSTEQGCIIGQVVNVSCGVGRAMDLTPQELTGKTIAEEPHFCRRGIAGLVDAAKMYNRNANISKETEKNRLDLIEDALVDLVSVASTALGTTVRRVMKVTKRGQKRKKKSSRRYLR